MEIKNKILIILDSTKYKKHQERLLEKNEGSHLISFFFTDYENGLVRFFHGVPGIGNMFSHITYWTISLVDALKLFLFFKKRFPQKVFINPIVGFFYCLLNSVLRNNEKNHIVGFIFVPKSNRIYLSFRRWLVNTAYNKVTSIIVYSNAEVDLYSRWFPNLASKFKFVQYGRDFDIFEEHQFESEIEYIASGGSSNRDYNLLACALNLLVDKHPDLVCRIATRPNCILFDNKPKNLEILYNVRIDRFGSFLEKSLFVVIPLTNTSLSAGQMALLESMYRGKIILITDLPSVRDYVNEEQVYFYKKDDYEDLSKKIEQLYLNAKNPDYICKSDHLRHVYNSTFGFASFLDRILNESCLKK